MNEIQELEKKIAEAKQKLHSSVEQDSQPVLDLLDEFLEYRRRTQRRMISCRVRDYKDKYGQDWREQIFLDDTKEQVEWMNVESHIRQMETLRAFSSNGLKKIADEIQKEIDRRPGPNLGKQGCLKLAYPEVETDPTDKIG